MSDDNNTETNFSHYQYWSIRQKTGRIETGLTGKAWKSLDMNNNLFCGDKAQTSALIISASKIGSIVGTCMAGSLPNKYGRTRPIQAFVTAHFILYIILIFANELAGYGLGLRI